MSSSNTIVLRRVYALDSNTEQFLSAGQVLLTNSNGGTNWVPVLSTLEMAGGPAVGYLPSTLQILSSVNYITFSTLSTAIVNISTEQSIYNVTYSTITGAAFQDLSGFVYSQVAQVNPANLASTVQGLGTAQYVSTPSLVSTVVGLGTSTYVSSASLVSTVRGLGTVNYVSTASLVSTAQALGSLTYVSSASLVSSIIGLGTTSYVSTLSLISTVQNLGSVRYVSAASLASTTFWLQTAAFSTMSTMSTLAGLGTASYVSTASLTSSLIGLSNALVIGGGGISQSQLVSTTGSLQSNINTVSSAKAQIRFDNTGEVSVYGGNNDIFFNNVQQVIYLSTFFMSSVAFTGNSGTQITGQLQSPLIHDMVFSTASIDLSPFSPFIVSSSIITIDVYPHIAFSKLATGAQSLAVLPISTLVKYGADYISTVPVTSFLYAGGTRVILESGVPNSTIDASNFYNTPLKIRFPFSTVPGNYSKPYTLVHYMPSSLNNGQFQNALHSNFLTPFFSPTGSVFVSVQNLP